MRIQRVGERVLYTNPAVRVVHPRSAAVAIPWYLSGGIAAANCLAAYTPKGAASLAASYDNNAAPANGLPDGTYDAAPGVAPTWDAVNGWKWTTALEYLVTGVVPTALTWSYIVQFSNVTTSALLDNYNYLLSSLVGGAMAIMDGANAYSFCRYRNGGMLNVAPAFAAGSLAIANGNAFRNGVQEPGVIPAGAVPTAPMWVGRYNNAGAAVKCLLGNIQAIAIYNTTLTAPQVAAVSAAMAAL